MMMQVLMLKEPENFLPDTRIAFFAGGSLFSQMKGVSRFIMDNVAFAGIWHFYRDILLKKGNSAGLGSWFENNPFGKAFTWMLGYGSNDNEREKSFQSYHSNLIILALKDDTVIPLRGIKQAFGERFSRSGRIRVLEFPYPCNHENPFPVLNRKMDHGVDQAFRTVFVSVADFFMNVKPNASLNREIDQKAAAFTG
jgi:hypothetical protein